MRHKSVTDPLHLGWLLYLALLMELTQTGNAVSLDLRPEYDVCNPKTAFTGPNSIYMSALGDTTEVFANWTSSPSSRCELFIKTCSSCRIRIEAVNSFNFTAPQESRYRTQSGDSDCDRGYYFQLYDADYKNQTSLRVYSSVLPNNYSSMSSKLYIISCGSTPASSPYFEATNLTIRLRLTVEEKSQTISGTNNGNIYLLSSPYFPSSYVPNSEQYIFNFNGLQQTDYVTFTFDDWLISPAAKVIFTGANVHDLSGDSNRPYVISDGSSVTMTFDTGLNTYAGLTIPGFKAVARFYSDRTEIPTVEMGCDHLITAEGGIISLEEVADGKNHDCIWLIKKAPGYDGVYLKVVRYRATSGDSSLEVNDGLTSLGNKLIAPGALSYVNTEAFLSREGFYIRLKGSYMYDDSLKIAYAMYKNDCSDSYFYFKCSNGRCISATYKCDTYDHCGDRSDEASSVCNAASVDRGYSSDSYPISVGVIVPMVVSVFLVIVICLLIVFIRRCRRLDNSAFGNPMQSNPQNRGRRRRRHNPSVQMSVTVSSGEHPPSYDEVLQNTPIGYLNMAVCWSQEGGPAQPPSYEEAISPPPSITPAQSAQSILTSTTVVGSTNSLHLLGTARLNSPQHPSLTRATLTASMDPGAYVSSSSSSEDASDPDSHIDLSSSSDSSTDNEHNLFTASLTHSRSYHDVNKPDKNENKPMLVGGKDDNDNFRVELGPENTAKLVNNRNSQQKEGQEAAADASLRQRDERKNDKNRTRRGQGHQRRETERGENTGSEIYASRDGLNRSASRDGLNRSASRDGLNRSTSRDGLNMNASRDGLNRSASRDGLNRSTSRDGLNRSASRDGLNVHASRDSPNMSHASDSRSGARSENAARDGVYYKKNQQRGAHAGVYSKIPSVTESSRSQSCTNLYFGGGGAGLEDEDIRHEDKRFSYAGYGDVSLKRSDLDPFLSGRGLVRDRPVENLNGYTAQSCSNLRGDYSSSKMPDSRQHQSAKPLYPSKEAAAHSREKHHASSLSLASSHSMSLSAVPEDHSAQYTKYEDRKHPNRTRKAPDGRYPASRDEEIMAKHRSWHDSTPTSADIHQQRIPGTRSASVQNLEAGPRVNLSAPTPRQNSREENFPRQISGDGMSSGQEPRQLNDERHGHTAGARHSDNLGPQSAHARSGQDSYHRGAPRSNPEPIYQTPSQANRQQPTKQQPDISRSSGKHLEPIYQTPKVDSEIKTKSSTPEPIYQTPRNTPVQHPYPAQQAHQARSRPIPPMQNKPVPAPRQGIKKSPAQQSETRPVPVSRSQSGHTSRGNPPPRSPAQLSPQVGPPHQGPPHQGPPHQGPPHQGPPHQGPPHQGPPHQSPPYQGPPHQGPPHQGPPHQGPPHQGPPHQGPPHQGPPRQGPPRQASHHNTAQGDEGRRTEPSPEAQGVLTLDPKFFDQAEKDVFV
ncbi:uncharacterized protein LOC131938302 isoform X2 [Physella acuta]|uniref:uncharacterized protein LOC131938302 isoform X2 n=1 Tax=Physella acuta TaxID=109671 RepID=UPI0027DAD9CC|nr:uncharacterized protein LOC131938302 isoform X2 [Physella acuta]